MKSIAVSGLLLVGTLCLGTGRGGWSHETYEVTFTNITQGAVLTPPIFSLSHDKIEVFNVGEAAGPALEALAEGGSTDELKAEFEAEGVQDLVQMMMPVLPGQSVTVELEGNRWSHLNLASMVLPTNDGFTAMNGPRIYQRSGYKTFYLRAYDAGTEENDEMCTSIPGPHCGGEGFNAEGGEGFVAPHAGIHGEADLSRKLYNWSDPVAIVKVRVID
jgi:hypothetical protein